MNELPKVSKETISRLVKLNTTDTVELLNWIRLGNLVFHTDPQSIGLPDRNRQWEAFARQDGIIERVVYFLDEEANPREVVSTLINEVLPIFRHNLESPVRYLEQVGTNSHWTPTHELELINTLQHIGLKRPAPDLTQRISKLAEHPIEIYSISNFLQKRRSKFFTCIALIFIAATLVYVPFESTFLKGPNRSKAYEGYAFIWSPPNPVKICTKTYGETVEPYQGINEIVQSSTRKCSAKPIFSQIFIATIVVTLIFAALGVLIRGKNHA